MMPYCRNCGAYLEEVDNYCEHCGKMRKKISSVSDILGKTCPFCQFPIKNDLEGLICSECKTPHHRECWEQNGECTTYGCNGYTYRPANEFSIGYESNKVSFWERLVKWMEEILE